jgi:hypothetical protein
VGIDLGDGLLAGARRVVDGLAVGLLVDAGRLAGGLVVGAPRLVEEVTEGVTLALGVPVPALRLAEAVGVGEPDAPGENVVGVEGGEDPEHADSDREASTVTAAKPTAVSVLLNPRGRRRA